jgi:hypothetical protein
MEQVRDRTTTVRTAEDESICQTVISAVAEARGVAPTELETPLFQAIDPDALERLLSGDDRPGSATTIVGFDWAGCSVVVHGTGQVEVVVRGSASR